MSLSSTRKGAGSFWKIESAVVVRRRSATEKAAGLVSRPARKHSFESTTRFLDVDEDDGAQQIRIESWVWPEYRPYRSETICARHVKVMDPSD